MMTPRRVVASVLLTFLIGFGNAQAAPLKVGLILDKGGKDDKSFNSAAYRGAAQAQKELGIKLKVVEATDDTAFEPLLRAFARRKFDIVFGIGIAQQEAVKKVATKFPNQKFSIVDAEVNLGNVRSLLFQEHEGSYLVGALAAMKSKSGIIGFIGGMDVPLIRRFQLGYESGAKFINPKIKVKSNYVGVTATAWNNPAKGKELALAQYNGGADVVYAAAGGSGMGLFDAAEEQKKYAIGVDSNQNWIKPGFVLTSMMKRVDVAVLQTIKDVLAGKFTPGTKRYGLDNGGVDFALDRHNKSLIQPEELSRLRTIKKKIISGKIKVPDYYKKGRG